MPSPSENKTIQSRILQYAQIIGWTFVSRSDAEKRRSFSDGDDIQDRRRTSPPYFEDTIYSKVKEFNPRYSETEGALVSLFKHLHPDIYGNRDLLKYFRNEKTFFDNEANRDLNLIVIGYDNPGNNIYEVTEEFYLYASLCTASQYLMG